MTGYVSNSAFSNLSEGFMSTLDFLLCFRYRQKQIPEMRRTVIMLRAAAIAVWVCELIRGLTAEVGAELEAEVETEEAAEVEATVVAEVEEDTFERALDT